MDISALNGRWVLETIEGKPAAAEQDVYFQIDGQTISGFDGCNRFGGNLSQPSLMRKSQRACLAAGVALPIDLANPLPQLTSARLEGDQLVVPLPGGAGEARFRRK
jgi:META domain